MGSNEQLVCFVISKFVTGFPLERRGLPQRICVLGFVLECATVYAALAPARESSKSGDSPSYITSLLKRGETSCNP